MRLLFIKPKMCAMYFYLVVYLSTTVMCPLTAFRTYNGCINNVLHYAISRCIVVKLVIALSCLTATNEKKKQYNFHLKSNTKNTNLTQCVHDRLPE